MKTKGKYVVGFDMPSASILGTGNNSGIFPLTLTEAKAKVSEHKKYPKDPEFVIYRLVRVKLKEK